MNILQHIKNQKLFLKNSKDILINKLIHYKLKLRKKE